jgi:ubiquinol-cytochrome c reductase cytochrome b subunit
MKMLLEWLDHRTGFRGLLNEMLFEKIPGGARWRYVTGSMLTFAFVCQAITGIFLWMAYSPSSQTAWESVYYIQHEMTGGWLVRGIHHFMAQAMVVVMAIHLLQVVVDGAYRAPREMNYWLGLVLMQITMGLGLTGYLLPWDQKGYWATNVATNLMTLVPFVGADLQRVVVGGSEYGHATLTRFFALHAGVLPVLLIGFLSLHIMLFRRHGITAHVKPGRSDEYFWPRQVLIDGLACLAMLLVVLACVIKFDLPGLVTGSLPAGGTLGAELGAPADPSQAYSAARPEWYYLFLFQLLKFFEGSNEWIGAIVLPGAVMGLLFLFPIVGRANIGHKFNVLVILVLLGGAAGLTGMALVDDHFATVAKKFNLDKEKYAKKIAASADFHAAVELAEKEAARTIELVQRRQVVNGEVSQPMLIPKLGAVYLLRNDPQTQGPKLFQTHCGSCHSYSDPDGNDPVKIVPESVSAPNLYGFASRSWIAGIVDHQQVDRAAYFGQTAHKEGEMVSFVKDNLKDLDDTKKAALQDLVAALSAEARLPSQREADEKAQADGILARGKEAFGKTFSCTDCHRWGDQGDAGSAPDLTGYGSYEWLLGFISDPTHARFYGDDNDRMPSFAKDLEAPATHSLSVREISLIADWLRGEYYRPADAKPVLPHDEEFARLTVRQSRGGLPGSAAAAPAAKSGE